MRAVARREPRKMPEKPKKKEPGLPSRERGNAPLFGTLGSSGFPLLGREENGRKFRTREEPKTEEPRPAPPSMPRSDRNWQLYM